MNRPLSRWTSLPLDQYSGRRRRRRRSSCVLGALEEKIIDGCRNLRKLIKTEIKETVFLNGVRELLRGKNARAHNDRVPGPSALTCRRF